MGSYEFIRGRDNQRLKWVRAVREGKERDLIFIEGNRLAEEALTSPIEITEAYFAEGIENDEIPNRILNTLVESGIHPTGIKRTLFDSVADTESPQGIILIAKRPWLRAANDSSLGVFLNEVNNPSNLGAIVRTSEAAGVSALLVSPRSADSFSSKSIRASMGSCFRLPIIEKLSFEDAASWASSKGMKLAAATADASMNYTDVDWTEPKMLVLGSEAHGLGSKIAERAEEFVKIPMSGTVESLNLAVAAGIILFEAKRQRDKA